MTQFDGILNFRDLGGTVTADGHTVKPGLLYRCGSLVNASDDDIERLRGTMGLRRVFDFRSKYEINLSPDRDIDGVTNTNLELLDLAGEVWKQVLALDDSEESPMMRLVNLAKTERVRNLARGMYVFLAGSPTAMQQYRKFLLALADDTPGATLWHCSYGKDRTGVGTALILAALGCDKQTIIDDYSISNVCYASRVSKVLELVPEGDNATAEVIRTFIGANARYFDMGLEAALAKFGSAELYFGKGLGIGEETISKLKRKYLQ